MIPDEVSEFIGRSEPPHVRVVERGDIRRYADAVGNDNPIYHDAEHANRTRYGGIIAPPGFFGWPMKPAAASTGLPPIVADLQAVLARAGYPRILDGGVSYEFFLPVRAGDVLVVSPRIKEVTTKEGKSGQMMICSMETTYLNQNGDMVARAYQNFIAR
jgi:acyl dehydratase